MHSVRLCVSLLEQTRISNKVSKRFGLQWVGKGAESPGLSGECAQKTLKLRVNLCPGTRERLTARTKETRQPTLAEAFRQRNADPAQLTRSLTRKASWRTGLLLCRSRQAGEHRGRVLPRKPAYPCA